MAGDIDLLQAESAGSPKASSGKGDASFKVSASEMPGLIFGNCRKIDDEREYIHGILS